MTDGPTGVPGADPPGAESGAGAPAVGAEVELAVERVAPGGHCVAHHAGRVVFVRHTLPGERVTARITEVHTSFLRADAVRVRDAAPDRVRPPCRYAGPGRCGGCDWQHVAPAAQRSLKAAVVAELLVRLGGMTADEVAALDVRVAELPGGPLGWRTRVRYAVDRHGRAGLRASRSHRVVPVDECLIAAPAVRALPVTAARWPPGTEITAVAASSGQSAVLSHRPVAGGRARSRARGRAPDRAGTAPVGPARLVGGDAELTERAAGREFAVPAEAFWQVHPAAPDHLVRQAVRLLAPRHGERALDLYGGVGLFAAALAGAVGPAGSVTLVESGRTAVAAAERNLADLPQVRVVAARVEDVLPDLPPADVVVLDPPRTGAGREVVAGLAAGHARAVCYVACDAAALARDIRTFRESGWRLTSLYAVDAFPMTRHVECVALLEPVS